MIDPDVVFEIQKCLKTQDDPGERTVVPKLSCLVFESWIGTTCFGDRHGDPNGKRFDKSIVKIPIAKFKMKMNVIAHNADRMHPHAIPLRRPPNDCLHKISVVWFGKGPVTPS